VKIASRPGELRFLDPAVVARIASMELRARTVVEGFLSGLHQSPNRGFSVEFAEYRPYLPGDDLAAIDWKVYARSDRYYVKKYEEETNLTCHLLLDVSASMGYASAAYLIVRQRDSVGLMAFDDALVTMLPASARPGHLHGLLVSLDRLELGHRSNVSGPLHRVAEMLKKRGLVVLISDLLDEPDAVIGGLKHLRFRGSDVIVFHVLDPHELTFPFERESRFRDLETSSEVLAVPAAVRAGYLRRMGALLEVYERELRTVGIDYHRLETSQPLDLALMRYLSTRSRLM
jgi:uncharacterized protein (DUF58 family)